MATGTVIKVWQDTTAVYAAVWVTEAAGRVEYVGSVDLATFNALPDAASKKASLVAAVKAVRDAQQAGPQPVAGITGTVTI